MVKGSYIQYLASATISQHSKLFFSYVWILPKRPRVKSREFRKAASHFRLPMVRLDTHCLMENWWFFLHSFCIFSKSILFNKNLIRMNFKWVYFRGGKPCRCFSIYIQKWRSYRYPLIISILSLSSISARSNYQELSSCPIFCWINVIRNDEKRVVYLYMIYMSIEY